MLTGVGTPQEQWLEAGVEVALGRLDIRDLYDLGTRLFREAFADLEERIEELETDNERLRIQMEADLTQQIEWTQQLTKGITEIRELLAKAKRSRKP